MNKKSLTEADIEAKYITPAIIAAGWNEHTQIGRQVYFTNGRIYVNGRVTARGKRKFADYILYYKPNIPIAIIESKENNHSVSSGMQQALNYSDILDIPFVFSSNGDGFRFHDKTVVDGDIEKDLLLNEFPSPEELWAKYKIHKGISEETTEKAVSQDYHFDANSNRSPRYYQQIAINRTVEAIAKGDPRILLVMATGTGKTYTAFQIAYRLWKSKVKQRILFLADRTALVDQTLRGDFILSKIDAMNGAFGIISSEVDEAIITGNFWAYNVDKDKVDSEWFLYFTHSMTFIDICKKSSTGTTHRKYLDEKIFLSYKLFLPDIDTQKKQVATFQNLNHHTNIIAKEVSRQREYLAKLKQSILQDAICGKFTEDWREANPNIEPASELLKRIKAEKQRQIKEGKIRKEKPLDPITDTDLPFTIPPTWQWCRLGDLLISSEGGKSPDCLNQCVKTNEFGVIKTTAIQEFGFVQDENKILPSGFTISDKHKIRINDVLITRAGPLNRTGVVCCVDKIDYNLILSDKTIRLNFNNDYILPKYITFVLNNQQIKKTIIGKMTGMANSQVNISQDNMKLYLFTLPPIEEQKRIVEIIKNSLEKCSLIEAQITANEQTAQNLIKSILCETFNNN